MAARLGPRSTCRLFRRRHHDRLRMRASSGSVAQRAPRSWVLPRALGPCPAGARTRRTRPSARGPRPRAPWGMGLLKRLGHGCHHLIAPGRGHGRGCGVPTVQRVADGAPAVRSSRRRPGGEAVDSTIRPTWRSSSSLPRVQGAAFHRLSLPDTITLSPGYQHCTGAEPRPLIIVSSSRSNASAGAERRRDDPPRAQVGDQ